MDLQIERNFQYHKPNPNTSEKYDKINHQAKGLAYAVLDLCPDSRERSLAITKIEEAKMWANAAIARNSDVGQVK